MALGTIEIKTDPKLVDVLERIANALEAGSAPNKTSPSKKSSAETAPKTKPKSEKPAKDDTPEEVTRDDVRGWLSKVHESSLCKENKVTPVHCLSRGGVKKLPELDPANFQKVIDSAKRALDTGEA